MIGNKEYYFKVKAFIWSAINPKTNVLEKSSKKPTIEQMYWNDFAYNTTDLYDCHYSFHRYHKIEGFRLYVRALGNWEKDYIQTEKEVTDIVNDIALCESFADLEALFELHGINIY